MQGFLDTTLKLIDPYLIKRFYKFWDIYNLLILFRLLNSITCGTRKDLMRILVKRLSQDNNTANLQMMITYYILIVVNPSL